MRIPDYTYVDEIEDLELRRVTMRELAKRDLWFLAKYILRYEDLETKTDIHYRLCKELSEQPHRYLVLIPRGFFKTSLALAKMIQILINDPSAQIGIGSDVEERAIIRTRDLRDMIQGTPLLYTLFPEVFYANAKQEADLWKASEFNIRRPPRHEMTGGFRHPSVSAFGLDPTPVGSHYTHVYLDDVENDSNNKNLDQIKKLLGQMRALFPILKPDTPVLMTGTIWAENGPNTVYQSRPGWKVYKRRVRKGNGLYPNAPTAPSVYNEEALRQKETDINDPSYWSGQYLLEYMPDTGMMFFPFRGAQFKFCQYIHQGPGMGEILRGHHVLSLEDCLVYITVDPSGGVGEDQANSQIDKVGWSVNAVSMDGAWHILEMGAEWLDDSQFIVKLFDLYHKWDPYTIGIEKMPHLETAIRLAFKARGETLPISELRPKKRAKSERIRGLHPLLGGIYFLNGKGYETHLSNYYTEMEHGDDAPDSLAYQIDIARPPTKAMIAKRRADKKEKSLKDQLAALPPNDRLEWEHLLLEEQRRKNPQHTAYQKGISEMYGVFQ